MISFQYDSYKYFFDLLAFTLLLAPLFYLLKGDTARRTAMTLGSMYVMYFIAPRLVLFYIFFWCAIFGLQRMIAALEKKSGSGYFFPAAIILALLPMLAWKWYGDDFNTSFNLVMNGFLKPLSWPLWEIDMARSLVTPVGISFAAFRSVDLIVKTYLGRLEALTFGEVMFYGFFAPVQMVGPISEYEETATVSQKPDPQNVYEGLLRVAVGFIKVFALSSLLSGSGGMIAHPEGLTTIEAWGVLVAYAFYFYLNFSGYADIAIGVARIYGFRLKENFYLPLLRPRNIQEFWASWHMSLTRFAQRNIFVPLGGYRPKTQYFAIFTTMMVIALWHDLNWSLVVFGVLHGAGLVINRIYAQKLGEKRKPGLAEATFYRLFTFIYVSLGFPLVMASSLADIAPFYKTLAGL